jgi:hypothetical protein
VLSAEDWYDAFYKAYFRFPAINVVLKGRKVSDTEWTRIMKMEFLPSLASKLGCTVSLETLGVDQLWNRNEQVVVAIEHENDFSSIQTELGNLSAINAPLKVLITYVGDGELTWRSYDLSEKVKQHLERKQEHGEFLFLVADGKGTDWATFKFMPKLIPQMSVLPPPTAGHKAARTRREGSTST